MDPYGRRFGNDGARSYDLYEESHSASRIDESSIEEQAMEARMRVLNECEESLAAIEEAKREAKGSRRLSTPPSGRGRLQRVGGRYQYEPPRAERAKFCPRLLQDQSLDQVRC